MVFFGGGEIGEGVRHEAGSRVFFLSLPPLGVFCLNLCRNSSVFRVVPTFPWKKFVGFVLIFFIIYFFLLLAVLTVLTGVVL